MVDGAWNIRLSPGEYLVLVSGVALLSRLLTIQPACQSCLKCVPSLLAWLEDRAVFSLVSCLE